MSPDLSPAKQALLTRLLRGEAAPPDCHAIEKRPAGRAPPLSVEQEHVWLHAAMAPGLPMYNESITIHRRGSFDLAVMRDTVNEIVRDTEIWRTGFEEEHGGIVQRVHETVAVPVRFTDLAHFPPPAREARARAIGTRDSRRPFDLARPPLLRCRVVRFDAAEHRLYLTLHHIIFDGVSIYRVLMPRLTSIYARRSGRQPPVAVPAGPHYGDYALWRQRRAAGPEVARQMDFWRDMLGGELPVLRLPTDDPPATPSHRAGMITFALSAARTRGVRDLAIRLGVTQYAVLLAVFQVLLFRCSGQADLIVGGVTDMRLHPALEHMIGYFLNSFPIRTKPSAQTSFADYARQTGAVVTDCLDACEAPFSAIVRAVNPARDAAAHPLFRVMFSVEPPAPSFAEGWDLTQMDVPVGAAKFDLYLELDERPAGLVGRLIYRCDLFRPATARRLVDHWRCLLDAAIRDPAAPIGRMEMLTPRERRLAATWHGPRRAIPTGTIADLVRRQASANPDTIAVVSGRKRTTFRALQDHADRIAEDLREERVVPGSIVGVAVDRGAALVASLLAILGAGAAYLPLDTSLPAARLRHYLAEARPDIILTQPHRAGALPADHARLLMVPDNGEPRGPRRPRTGDGGGLAYVLFTSGTSGAPKAVAIEHRALLNLLHAMQRTFSFSARDSLLAVTTLSFDIAALEIFLPLMTGGTIVMAADEEAGDPARIAALLRDARPTVMQATPTLWRALIDAGWRGAEGLKILSGGETLGRDLADALLSRAAGVWNLYGPTETTIWSTAHRVRAGPGPVPIGRSIANTTAFVLDPDGTECAVGVPGELHIGGAGLARGYLHQPDLTAARFRSHPALDGARLYRTGDLARRRADGSLDCLGRLDDQVKIRGHRVAPGEVEAALRAHPDVADASVVADAAGSGLVAYVVARAGRTPSAQALRRHLGETLPAYMVPGSFALLPELPRGATGKLDRAKLAALSGPPAGSRPPRTPTEIAIAAIFTELTRVADIGAEDSFFDLGGHSLLAARLAGRIEQSFRSRLTLPEIFRHPTVAGLASCLADPREPAGHSPHRRLMLGFESLGEDCEFGLVQRRHGAEPFGLLRFAGIAADDLAVALRDRFDAIADPAVLRIEREAAGWILHNDRYRCAYILPVPHDADADTMLRSEAAKLRAMRPMLLRGLARGQRICVVKARDTLGAGQIAALRQAIRDLGPATLLIVRGAASAARAGTVDRLDENLLAGWLDRLAPDQDPSDASPLWVSLCEAARRMVDVR